MSPTSRRHENSVKVYYTVDDKNITEMQAVGYAVSEAGIRAPLYWFHAAGYFEEFLGHKKDMWEHPTGLRIDDEKILEKTAKNLAELHQGRFSLNFLW